MIKKLIITLVVVVLIFAGYKFLEYQGVFEGDIPLAPIEATETHGAYQMYSPELLARAETGKVIIFFYATWCPSCRSLDRDIRGNINDVPSDVTILIADYDNSADLKQKYGITTQHSFVQVDAEGNELNKWFGHPTLELILEELK